MLWKREKIWWNIKGKIKPTFSIIKSGVKEHLNGNVNVIIPCAFIKRNQLKNNLFINNI